MTYWPFISNAGQYSLVTASILLAGCATRPLPQDVTQLETVQIVNRIRCETKNALQDQIISYLSTESADSNSIAKQLRADPKQFVNFDRSRLSAEALKTINLYDGTAVAYDFSFDITEKNSLDTEFGLQKKGSAGLFTGGSSVRTS